MFLLLLLLIIGPPPPPPPPPHPPPPPPPISTLFVLLPRPRLRGSRSWPPRAPMHALLAPLV
eukprot:4269105-Pyramimonas_sp.AAC.1